MGDSTDHNAAALMASLKPILDDLVGLGKKRINVTTDSPTNQYRNKDMFYLCKQFTVAHLMENGLRETVHAVYSDSDIKYNREKVPKLKFISGTMKIHEMLYTVSEVVLKSKNMSKDSKYTIQTLMLDNGDFIAWSNLLDGFEKQLLPARDSFNSFKTPIVLHVCRMAGS